MNPMGKPVMENILVFARLFPVAVTAYAGKSDSRGGLIFNW